MKKIICGNETDRMPDISFRIMTLIFKVYDFFKPFDRHIDDFGIQPGFTVVDYGCGPGRHVRRASELVGENGRVIATDIQRLAVQSVEKLVKKHNLVNVTVVQAGKTESAIPDNSADLIYAVDMFHMVSNPNAFLKELTRITKPNGILILEDGHQPRKSTLMKIRNSGCWEITEENKHHLQCKPIK